MQRTTPSYSKISTSWPDGKLSTAWNSIQRNAMCSPRSPSIFNYTLHGTNLKSTESTKYLGVTLTNDLTWGKHIDIIRAKANQQLAFVRRNIRTRSSSTKEKLFNTLVRPHLEYAATVWDPHISKQKHSLEMVQRRAARWVTNRHHNTSSVTTCSTH